MISREEQASYQYNTLYQLTGAVYEKQPGEFIPEARTNESYQYDGVGNRTKATVNQTEATSHYNAFNQLTQQGNTHFEYDANGNLIKRGKRNADNDIAIDPTGTPPYWQYLYDSRERLIEVREDGNTVARYGYNPKGRSPATAPINWQARSDSFGQTTINDKSTLTSNLRLPGQYYDSETGLHYNWFRYYDPSLGR